MAHREMHTKSHNFEMRQRPVPVLLCTEGTSQHILPTLTSVCVYFSVRTSVRAASNMVEVFVDGKPVEVEAGTTVLQVFKQLHWFC